MILKDFLSLKFGVFIIFKSCVCLYCFKIELFLQCINEFVMLVKLTADIIACLAIDDQLK